MGQCKRYLSMAADLDSGHMTQDELKQSVAREAIKYIVDGEVIGVGSGSTADFFIDELGKVRNRIAGAVASSEKTAERLKRHGIRLFDLNGVNELPVYIDGADEITEHLAMIKGGGGALTREKIVAAVAKKFVCIADESKLVPVLGKFPLPVEVVSFGLSTTRRAIENAAAGAGAPGPITLRRTRDGHAFVTEGGHLILDAALTRIIEPQLLADRLAGIPGVVEHGLFIGLAKTAIIAGTDGVRVVERP